jgi:hypothetical protein
MIRFSWLFFICWLHCAHSQLLNFNEHDALMSLYDSLCSLFFFFQNVFYLFTCVCVIVVQIATNDFARDSIYRHVALAQW